MKKAVTLAALLIPSLALSQQLVTFQPEPDFEMGVAKAIAAVKPQDAFGSSSECRLVDAKYLAPVPIAKAEKLLGACLAAVAARYGGVDLSASHGTPSHADSFTAQVEMLMILVPKSVGSATPLMRDLGHALKARNGRLLGYPAIIERIEDRAATALEAAPAQDALDACMLPAVVRKIETGEDFIKYYGGCLRQARGLRVLEMRQSPAQKLGVIVLSSADRPVVAAMTGPVKVVASNGPVEVQLVAYANPVYLP